MSLHSDNDRFSYGIFNQPPEVDPLLYELATVKAERVELGNTIVYNIDDNVFDKICSAFKEIGYHEELFGSHFVRCLLEQPNKIPLLVQLLNDIRLNHDQGALSKIVIKTLYEYLSRCNNIFFFCLCSSALSKIDPLWQTAGLNALFRRIQDSSVSLLECKALLISSLTSAACMERIAKFFTFYTSALRINVLSADDRLDVTLPWVCSFEHSEPFGAASGYLGPARDTHAESVLAQVCKSIAHQPSQEAKIDDDDTNDIPAFRLAFDQTQYLQSIQFSFADEMIDYLHGWKQSKTLLNRADFSIFLLRRYLCIQHILWVNRFDHQSCAIAILHAPEECFSEGGIQPQHETPPTMSMALKVLCVLEDFCMLSAPVLVSSEVSHGDSHPLRQHSAKLTFTIGLLRALSNGPKAFHGHVVTSTLLTLLTHAFTRVHTLDIEVADRLRLLIVYYIYSQNFLFPWQSWYVLTTESVDDRILVCRKLFLFEVIRDLTDLSFPHRIREALPKSLHKFIPSLKLPNTDLIKNKTFENLVANADCNTVRENYVQIKSPENTIQIMVLDAILKHSRVSLSRQKELLMKFYDIFVDCTTKTKEAIEANMPDAVNGDSRLLGHVYFFWKNDHTNRVQTLRNLLDVGIVKPVSIASWLTETSIEGVIEQSWTRQLVIYAARLTLEKWLQSKSASNDSDKNRESGNVKAFFFHTFQVLAIRMTNLSDNENQEIDTFHQQSNFSNQPNSSWSTRNVLIFHSLLGLLRWLVRVYFSYGISVVFPDHERQITDIIFPIGSCHDFLAQLWRESILLFGRDIDISQRASIEKELEKAKKGKHEDYRRYQERKRKRESVE